MRNQQGNKDSFNWLNLSVKHSFAAAILILFTFGCQTSRQYNSKPAPTANPENEVIESRAIAYHLDDSTTRIYMEISNENLLYKRSDTSSSFFSNVKISWKAIPEAYSRKILDSGSFYLNDKVAKEKAEARPIHSSFDLQLYKGSNAELSLEITDLNRKNKFSSVLYLNKSTPGNKQYFLVRQGDSIAYRNYFPAGKVIRIVYQNLSIEQLTVDCYPKETGPAPPPFSVRQNEQPLPEPDSSYVVIPRQSSVEIKMPEKGFYFIRSGEKEGFALMTFERTFPSIGSPDEMIHCCRYIMSHEEYEGCIDSPDKKAAIDKFWLGIGGSNERARELVRRYYGRVKDANKNFSSYFQGWKSDRGMIFIVFGPPVNIYRSRNDEIWVYGNEANPSAVRFVFNHNQSSFSNNDFVLERSAFYKEPWHTMVDYWRQGTIYMESRR
jgi:GWxTD domain-containing protein